MEEEEETVLVWEHGQWKRMLVRGGLGADLLLQPSTALSLMAAWTPNSTWNNKCGQLGLQENPCLRVSIQLPPHRCCHVRSPRERHTGLANIVKYIKIFIP